MIEFKEPPSPNANPYKTTTHIIDTRDFFVGMHNQPILKELKLINKNQKFPNSDYLEKNGIYIPSGPDIKDNEIKFVAKSINLFLK